MSYRFVMLEAGSVELTSPDDYQLMHAMTSAGVDYDRANELAYEIPRVRDREFTRDLGNGVTLSRRLVNRRRVYAIRWERKIERSRR